MSVENLISSITGKVDIGKDQDDIVFDVDKFSIPM